MRTRAHRHIRATLRVRLVCSPLRLCRLTYYLARRRLWLCSTWRVQLHGYMVADRSHQVSPQVCQVRISLCNGKLHTCFVTSSCTYTDRIKLPRCSAPALPLLCRCCTATAAERCRRFKRTGRCRHAAASSLQQDTWADGDAPPKDQPQSAQEPSAHGPCSMPCALTVQHVPCVLTVCTADSYKHM